MLTYQCDIQMSSAELWVQKFENATNSFHSIYYKFAPPEEERLGKKRSRTEWQIPISQYDSAQHSYQSLYNYSKADHPYHLEKRSNEDM